MRDYRVKTFMQKCVDVFFRRVYTKREKVETSPKTQKKKLLFLLISLSTTNFISPDRIALSLLSFSWHVFQITPKTYTRTYFPTESRTVSSLVSLVSLSADLLSDQFV